MRRVQDCVASCCRRVLARQLVANRALLGPVFLGLLGGFLGSAGPCKKIGLVSACVPRLGRPVAHKQEWFRVVSLVSKPSVQADCLWDFSVGSGHARSPNSSCLGVRVFLGLQATGVRKLVPTFGLGRCPKQASLSFRLVRSQPEKLFGFVFLGLLGAFFGLAVVRMPAVFRLVFLGFVCQVCVHTASGNSSWGRAAPKVSFEDVLLCFVGHFARSLFPGGCFGWVGCWVPKQALFRLCSCGLWEH